MSIDSLIVSFIPNNERTEIQNLNSVREQLYIHYSPSAHKLFSCGGKLEEVNVKEPHHLQRAPSAAHGELN